MEYDEMNKYVKTNISFIGTVSIAKKIVRVHKKKNDDYGG